MTIYTVKFTKKMLIAAILVVAAIIGAIILFLPGKDSGEGGSQTTAAIKIKSESDCVEYIKSLGYSVAPEAASSRMVTIPQTFDRIYEKYNEIQQACGFDLEKYKGKGVSLFTYQIVNYEGYDDVLVDVIVYKNKVIGGAIYTASIDGFMHGLKKNPGA